MLALAFGCSPPSSGGAEPLAGELKRREPTRVRTAPLEVREMVATLSTPATVESSREVTVVPRTTGIVTEVFVEEGDRVEEGQVLAVIDPRPARAAYEHAQLALRDANEQLPVLALRKAEAEERMEGARLRWEQATRDVEANEKAGLISKNELDKLKLARDTGFRDFQAAKLALEAAVQEEKAGQTMIEKARVAVTEADLSLSFTEIVAPFDGIIAMRSVRVGELVKTLDTAIGAFTLCDDDDVRSVIHRPQRELPLFRRALDGPHNGDQGGPPPIEIRAYAEAVPDQVFEGHILFVSPTVDAASGSFRVTIELEQPERESGRPRLQPGMLVRLAIITDRHPEALVVPKRALRREADSAFVYAVREGLAQRVEVLESFSSDEDVEIVPVHEGTLEVGEAIVVVGNRDLEDGDDVQAEPWGEPAPAVAAETDDAAAEDEDGGDGEAAAPEATAEADTSADSTATGAEVD